MRKMRKRKCWYCREKFFFSTATDEKHFDSQFCEDRYNGVAVKRNKKSPRNYSPRNRREDNTKGKKEGLAS